MIGEPFGGLFAASDELFVFFGFGLGFVGGGAEGAGGEGGDGAAGGEGGGVFFGLFPGVIFHDDFGI